jgi:starvation-inducible DNA-binding protein
MLNRGRLDERFDQGDEMHTVRAQRFSHHPAGRHAQPVSLETRDLSMGLMKARADTFHLHQKIKSGRRRISGPHFHQYRTLLQAHAEELAAASHALDERIRDLRAGEKPSLELGINILSSHEDEAEYVTPEDLLVQLRLDNQILVGSLRSAQALCQRSGDIVTESLIDGWIYEARRRAVVLMEATWDD